MGPRGADLGYARPVPRELSVLFVLCGLALTAASPAAAQGGPGDDAGSGTPVPLPSANPMVVPTASGTSTARGERPARGAAVRERGGRRSRGGSAASGALVLIVIVAALGTYVVKRLRR